MPKAERIRCCCFIPAVRFSHTCSFTLSGPRTCMRLTSRVDDVTNKHPGRHPGSVEAESVAVAEELSSSWADPDPIPDLDPPVAEELSCSSRMSSQPAVRRERADGIREDRT